MIIQPGIAALCPQTCIHFTVCECCSCTVEVRMLTEYIRTVICIAIRPIRQQNIKYALLHIYVTMLSNTVCSISMSIITYHVKLHVHSNIPYSW